MFVVAVNFVWINCSLCLETDCCSWCYRTCLTEGYAHLVLMQLFFRNSRKITCTHVALVPFSFYIHWLFISVVDKSGTMS